MRNVPRDTRQTHRGKKTCSATVQKSRKKKPLNDATSKIKVSTTFTCLPNLSTAKGINGKICSKRGRGMSKDCNNKSKSSPRRRPYTCIHQCADKAKRAGDVSITTPTHGTQQFTFILSIRFICSNSDNRRHPANMSGRLAGHRHRLPEARSHRMPTTLISAKRVYSSPLSELACPAWEYRFPVGGNVHKNPN